MATAAPELPGAHLTDLPGRDIAELARQGLERTYDRRAIVVSEGDRTDALYIVLSGRVKVFVADENGREVVLGEMTPGDYFGELVIDGGPRSASVATLEKTRFSVVSREVFAAFLEANPAFAMRFIKRLVKKVRELTKSVKNLALLDVYGRVARLLLDLAGPEGVIAQRLTHQEIANRVGSSREMVTRILKDLQTGGYVSIEGGRILVRKGLPSRW